MADDRPDNLVGRASQLTVKRPIDVGKARHKRLFNLIDGQERQAKGLR
jgi:hypothetical protein